MGRDLLRCVVCKCRGDTRVSVESIGLFLIIRSAAPSLWWVPNLIISVWPSDSAKVVQDQKPTIRTFHIANLAWQSNTVYQRRGSLAHKRRM